MDRLKSAKLDKFVAPGCVINLDQTGRCERSLKAYDKRSTLAVYTIVKRMELFLLSAGRDC